VVVDLARTVWDFPNKILMNDVVQAGSYYGTEWTLILDGCIVTISQLCFSFSFSVRLYKTCQWDDKVLRRLIGDGKLASRKSCHTSAAVSSSSSSWECPICFCNYDEVNRTTCCDKEICTECYLQLKPQKNTNAACPYCLSQRLKVERCLETPPKPESVEVANKTSVEAAATKGDSSSPSTAGHKGGGSSSSSSYCLTPEQRQSLEAKVMEQQIHPLAARLAQEEAERRLANELEYLSNHPGHYHHHHHRRPSHQSLHLLAPGGRSNSMTLSEEQQLAMAIEASLRTTSGSS
jgi:hypothetical protein